MLDNYEKNTDTHSEYLLFIAFPRQHWLRESASTLRICTLFFCDIFFESSFTSIGKEGTCVGDLIDQDADLTIVIAISRKYKFCNCCMSHISNNGVPLFFHTPRSWIPHASYNTHRLFPYTSSAGFTYNGHRHSPRDRNKFLYIIHKVFRLRVVK